MFPLEARTRLRERFAEDGKRLPTQNVTLAVCLTYFQFSEKRYVREQWEALADYKKVLSFKDTTLPQGALPKGDIVLEYSAAPLGCVST